MKKILFKLISGITIAVVAGYIVAYIVPEKSAPSVSSQTIQSNRQLNETASTTGMFGGSTSTSTSINGTSNISQSSSGNGTNINISSLGNEDSSVSINISGSGEGSNINVTTGK